MKKVYLLTVNKTDSRMADFFLYTGGYEYTNLFPRVFVVELDENEYEELRKQYFVVSLEEDVVANSSVEQPIANVYSANWGLDRIGQRETVLDSKYVYTRIGSGVDIYVLDTGIKQDHIEFGSRASVLGDFVTETDYPAGDDGNGHGTHVASIAAGNEFGVAKNANIFAVKVLNSRGRGFSSNILAGMSAVYQHHTTKPSNPSVANMSLGFNSRLNAIDTAVEDMTNAGIVVVVAAGNDGIDAASISPAGAKYAFTVGATAKDDSVASFSNFSSDQDNGDGTFPSSSSVSNTGSAVDIFAPGVSIVAAWPLNTQSKLVSNDSQTKTYLTTVPENQKIIKIRYQIIQVFDGSTRIKIGTESNPTEYADLDPARTARLGTVDVIVNASYDQLRDLYITKTGNPSQGRIIVTIYNQTRTASATLSGTSMASPLVAGVAALYLQNSSKTTTQTQVDAVTNFILEQSTKEAVRLINDPTPNRLLYMPYNSGDVFQWITESELGSFETDTAISKQLIAERISNTNQPLAVTYASNNVPSGLALSSSGILSGTLSVTESTDFTFDVEATSADNKTLSQSFTISAYPQPNEPPVWVTPAGQLFVDSPARNPEENELVSLQLQATDANASDVLEYTLLTGRKTGTTNELNLPGTMALSSTGLLSGTVTDIVEDTTLDFTVRVSDGTIVVDRAFSITFEAINSAPVWQNAVATVNLADFQGNLFTYNMTSSANTVYAEDPDGDALQFSVISGSLPSGTELSATGMLQGYLTYEGTYNFVVRASDSVLFADQAFEIIVQPAAQASDPVWITPAGSLGSYNELETMSVFVEADDPNDLDITYSINSGALPAGLTLDPVTGEIAGTPDDLIDTEEYTFTIIAENTNGDTNTRTFSLIIINTSGISAPIWETDAGLLGDIQEYEPSLYSVSAYDINNSEITYYLDLQPGENFPYGLTLQSNGDIQGTALNITSDTTYDFTVVADNGTFQTPRQFSLTVINSDADNYFDVYMPIFGELKSEVAGLLDTLPDQDIFRLNDPNFGYKNDLSLYIANGLAQPSDLKNDFYTSLSEHHKLTELLVDQFERKPIVLNGNHVCDVIVMKLYDPLQGQDYEITYPHAGSITTLYPNSIENMRSQIISSFGFDDEELLPPYLEEWKLEIPLAYVTIDSAYDVSELNVLYNQLVFVNHYVIEAAPEIEPTTFDVVFDSNNTTFDAEILASETYLIKMDTDQ